MVKALGTVPGRDGDGLELDQVLALWAADPVHPTQAAYWILAEKIAEKVVKVLSDT